MSIGFGGESWFVVGCFIADLSMAVSLLIIFLRRWMFLWRGIRKGGRVDWLVWLDEGKVWSWPKVFARACLRAPVLGFCFFAVTSVTADGVENTSSSQKRRVVLLKTSYRFAENNVSFYRKRRVVLLKTTCCFVESDGLFWIGGRKVVLRTVFWGGLGWSSSVKVWYFLNVVSVIGVNGY